MRKTRRLGLAGCVLSTAVLVPLVLTAGQAMASSDPACTGTGPTCVTGQVVIGSSMTVSLDSTSFTIDADPGYTVSTGGTGASVPASAETLYTVPTSYAVHATVETNTAGYSIDEVLADTHDGAPGFATNAPYYLGASSAGGSALTYAWTYPADDATIGAGGSFSLDWNATSGANGADLGSPVVSQNTTSAAAGDTWGLAWGWNVPGNQPSGTYSAYLNVVGLS
jgi:hypothetical protein